MTQTPSALPLKANPLDTPWKITSEIRRRLTIPWGHAYFAIHGVKWNQGWRMFGLPMIQRHRHSQIQLGDRLQMRNWFSSNPLGVNHRSVLATWSADATIIIGEQAAISGASLCAQTRIQIGDRVRLGANSIIADTDFHPLSVAQRLTQPKAGQSKPVIIGDDVFIGMNAIILKGVTIGDGAVIGAGSVVSRDVPAGVAAAGNPARPIREINS